MFVLTPCLRHFSAAGGRRHPSAIPNTIEQRVAACATCHGKDGEGSHGSEYYPRLAGKPAGYLYNQLINFRERRREFATMTYMVGYLLNDYLREIAEHYSTLNPPYLPSAAVASRDVLARGEALVHKGDAARGVPACASCHGQTLTGREPAIPGLVGLSDYYIGAQLGTHATARATFWARSAMTAILRAA